MVALQQVISETGTRCHPLGVIDHFSTGRTYHECYPEWGKMMGTFRAMDEAWRFRAHELITQISKSVAEGMGASLDLHIDVGYPVVHNNTKLNSLARSKAEELFGKENVEETRNAHGCWKILDIIHSRFPVVFFRLGVMNAAKGITSGVHTPTFNIDEGSHWKRYCDDGLAWQQCQFYRWVIQAVAGLQCWLVYVASHTFTFSFLLNKE